MTRTLTRALSALLLVGLLPCASAMPGKGRTGGGPKSVCLLSADFSSGIPAGWSVGAPVEQQDALGNGLGTFVDAWTAGTSAQANAHAWFPVPDVPSGNSFAMANDDAAPCNCAMSDVVLTSPSFDLAGAQNSVVRFRAFNNGAFGGGDGVVEASGDGSTWSAVTAIGAVANTWQWFQADLSAFDGLSTVNIRFRWNDNGGWAGGLAIDDICVNAREPHDLVLQDAFLCNAALTAFDPTQRTLGYTQLPMEQSGELMLKAVVFNAGSLAALNVECTVEVALNGALQGTFTGSLPAIGAGSTDTLLIPTGWTPLAAGAMDVTFTVTAISTDADPSDNTTMRSLRITAPGFAVGNNAMALDDSTVTGSIFNNEQDYAVAVRYEITLTGSSAFAVGFLPGEGSFVNGRIIGKLLDDQFNLLATSLEHVLTQVEIDDALTQGRMVYLPFVLPQALEADADVYAVIEHESDSGAVTVALSNAATHGSALFFDGPGIDWDYLLNVPVVRLYLAAPEVGMAEVVDHANALVVAPNPVSDRFVVRMEDDARGGFTWRLFDLSGTQVAGGRSSSGTAVIGTSDLASGSYLVVVETSTGRRTGRVVVAR